MFSVYSITASCVSRVIQLNLANSQSPRSSLCGRPCGKLSPDPGCVRVTTSCSRARQRRGRPAPNASRPLTLGPASSSRRSVSRGKYNEGSERGGGGQGPSIRCWRKWSESQSKRNRSWDAKLCLSSVIQSELVFYLFLLSTFHHTRFLFIRLIFPNLYGNFALSRLWPGLCRRMGRPDPFWVQFRAAITWIC